MLLSVRITVELTRNSPRLFSLCTGQMCGGYGRDLVSLAQQISAPQNSSASCTGADSAALSLGREGVGEIVALGPGLWAQGSGSGGEWALGQRVWFSPRIAGNQGALSGHVLLTPGEVAPAPEDLPDPEAASYPFAVSTAWTALVDCAGVQPAPLPASAAKFARRHATQGLDSPLDMLKAAGQQGLEMLGSLPLPGAAGELASRLRPVTLSPSAPRRALIHGASGAVGLVAVQLLQRWGWEVWATTTPATRSSLDKLQQEQAKAALTDQEGWGGLPPFHIVDSASTVAALSASASIQPHSLSLFLDGVGGDAPQVLQDALGLLAPSAQFVTLRGEGVAKIDRQGFLQGAISGSVCAFVVWVIGGDAVKMAAMLISFVALSLSHFPLFSLQRHLVRAMQSSCRGVQRRLPLGDQRAERDGDELRVGAGARGTLGAEPPARGAVARTGRRAPRSAARP